MSTALVKDSAEEFKSHDGNFEAWRADANRFDPTGRTTFYTLTGATRLMYASVGRLALIKVVGSLGASTDVLALGSIEVDLGDILEGTTMVAKWRGKPVFIRHRTDDEIAKAVAGDSDDMRDPQTDAERAIDPKWMVVLGVCTHLGCVPLGNAGEYNGWFCPCHGSHYDISGRIRKGPAPLNLEVPEYRFTGNTLILG